MKLVMNPDDGIERFIIAQETTYQRALNEIKNGKKESHWIWFVFPQIRGLGFTDYNIYYGIRDLIEAEEYLNHPILGLRLVEISEAILQINKKSIEEILPNPDIKKLKSSMSLFSLVPNTNPIFNKVLDKYYSGNVDENTIQILKELNQI
ncbi:MAG TPA: DUF1810 domain-containing protein [Flavobacterium sp.]|nr:DUF1810 domain-containing protein [Flavobacterium sp.]